MRAPRTQSDTEFRYDEFRDVARQRGWTLSQLSRACGTVDSYFSNCKTTGRVSRAKLEQACTILRVPVEDFLPGAEQAPEPERGLGYWEIAEQLGRIADALERIASTQEERA